LLSSRLAHNQLIVSTVTSRPLPGLAWQAVDQVAAEARAALLATRSIKREAKLKALDLAIRCIDLTTLEGADTPGKVEGLCAKATRPDPTDPTIPAVAALCVYPNLAELASRRLGGSSVRVAAVATAFPSGQASLDLKLAEARETAQVADEIDMVIDRGAFLAGDRRRVVEEIEAVKSVIGDRLLKVILETGELATLENVRRASWLAMEAGADFIKTSTGKVQPAATLPVALVMMDAIRDYAWETGRLVGLKVAGGIRTSRQAISYLVTLSETLGEEWLSPDRFRLGASSLLNDILMQIGKERSGDYQSPDDFGEA
jgi:deoxyribose-phosphate aldolase